MSKAVETIGAFTKAKAAVFTMFNVEGYLEIANHVGDDWYLHSDGMSFIEGEDEDECEYSFEYASKVGKTVDGIQMFAIQENGEKYYALFDLECKMTKEEAEKRLDY